jgi:hypothetical protein
MLWALDFTWWAPVQYVVYGRGLALEDVGGVRLALNLRQASKVQGQHSHPVAPAQQFAAGCAFVVVGEQLGCRLYGTARSQAVQGVNQRT